MFLKQACKTKREGYAAPSPAHSQTQCSHDGFRKDSFPPICKHNVRMPGFASFHTQLRQTQCPHDGVWRKRFILFVSKHVRPNRAGSWGGGGGVAKTKEPQDQKSRGPSDRRRDKRTGGPKDRSTTGPEPHHSNKNRTTPLKKRAQPHMPPKVSNPMEGSQVGKSCTQAPNLASTLQQNGFESQTLVILGSKQSPNSVQDVALGVRTDSAMPCKC